MARKGRESPSPVKLQSVEFIKEKIQGSNAIGVVNMYKMPAAQLQEMRKKLHGKAEIRMAKSSVVLRALDNVSKKGVGDLKVILSRPKMQPALIFTNDNPFALFKFLESNKSSAPAKVGDIAPKDIVIPAGDTGLPPGPAIGTLAAAGARAKVEGGKIHVIKDSLVTRAGEPVTPEVANVLGMLNIRPMEIGLDLVAISEGGIIYGKDVLRIDEIAFTSSLNTAITAGINLSLNTGYITKQTAPLAIMKAYREARGVALESGAYEKGVIEELLMKHAREYLALKSHDTAPKGEQNGGA